MLVYTALVGSVYAFWDLFFNWLYPDERAIRNARVSVICLLTSLLFPSTGPPLLRPPYF